MLAPRYLRKGVRERVISNGTVKTPLHEDDVRAACEFFIEEGVEAVAISFVWSVLNPEPRAARGRDRARDDAARSALTVGSELYPQMREYTRTSTAVVNAYLAPILSRYVAAVDRIFPAARREISGPLLPVERRPGARPGDVGAVRLRHQFRAGLGAAGGAFVAAPFKKKNVITIDMGGTSFDITLTKNGVTNINKNIDFLRYRIGIPMIQVETLGAGGGSIGWIDTHGPAAGRPAERRRATRDRPATARAAPSRPSPTPISCSAISIRRACSAAGCRSIWRRRATAIKSVADPLGISDRAGRLRHVHHRQQQHGQRHPPRLRRARLRSRAISCWSAPAARPPPISRRSPARSASTPSFCRNSPPGSAPSVRSSRTSNTTTWRPARCASKARPTRRSTACSKRSRRRASSISSPTASHKSAIRIERSLDMRYVGQVHECTVEIGNFAIDAKTIEKVKDAFHRRHEELYTYSERHNAVEVVNIESTLYGHVDKPQPPRVRKGVPPAKALVGHRKAIFAADGKRVQHAGLRRRQARRRRHDQRAGHHRGGDDDDRHRAGMDGAASTPAALT